MALIHHWEVGGEHGRTMLNVITVAHYAGYSCIVIKLAGNAFCLF